MCELLERKISCVSNQDDTSNVKNKNSTGNTNETSNKLTRVENIFLRLLVARFSKFGEVSSLMRGINADMTILGNLDTNSVIRFMSLLMKLCLLNSQNKFEKMSTEKKSNNKSSQKSPNDTDDQSNKLVITILQVFQKQLLYRAAEIAMKEDEKETESHVTGGKSNTDADSKITITEKVLSKSDRCRFVTHLIAKYVREVVSAANIIGMVFVCAFCACVFIIYSFVLLLL